MDLIYGDKFVAVANNGSADRVMHSTDGLTWTAAAESTTESWTTLSYNGSVYAAGSFQGSVMTSPDAITWTDQTSQAGAWRVSAANSSGRIIMMHGISGIHGGINDVQYSDDNGVTWTHASTGLDSSWYGIVYGDGKFVATGINGTTNNLAYSTDGITWNAGTSSRP